MATGIDSNDTQVEVEYYVDRSYDVAFDSAVVGPVAGDTTTLVHINVPTDHLLYLAGYDASGLPRIAVTNLNAR